MAKKKLVDITDAVGLNQTDKIVINQGGTSKQVLTSILTTDLVNKSTAAVIDTSGVAITDGAFIMYHRKSDNQPVLASWKEWGALQTGGEIADGVLVIQGSKHLVIAPTDTMLPWSSKAASIGTLITDRVIAMADFDGKSKTQAIISSPALGGDNEGFAPKYCSTYSRVNANGQGLSAGKWWLPSVGELMLILGNREKINKCLSVINGATQLNAGVHWSSTESSVPNAWALYLGNGSLYTSTKVATPLRVRSVSAFIV